jgi:hypothetical protein
MYTEAARVAGSVEDTQGIRALGETGQRTSPSKAAGSGSVPRAGLVVRRSVDIETHELAGIGVLLAIVVAGVIVIWREWRRGGG